MTCSGSYEDNDDGAGYMARRRRQRIQRHDRTPVQPFFPVTVKSTKEVAGFNALADALLRLDFVTAVRDIRRCVIDC